MWLKEKLQEQSEKRDDDDVLNFINSQPDFSSFAFSLKEEFI